MSFFATTFHHLLRRRNNCYSLSIYCKRTYRRNFCESSSSSSSSYTSPVLTSLHSSLSSREYKTKPLIIDSYGQHTSRDLLSRASHLSSYLLDHISNLKLQHQHLHDPIAVFLPADTTFVISLLSIWNLSVPVVPLSPLYPAAALRPLLKTVNPSCIITCHSLQHALPSTSIPIIPIDNILLEEASSTSSSSSSSTSTYKQIDHDILENPNNSIQLNSNNAIIFFTSGTTGNPKGVLWTHDMIDFQLQTLSKEWKWSKNDKIINILPLNHIHGLINIVFSSLYNLATLEMHNAFDAYSIFSSVTKKQSSPSIFMAVPSIYDKLVKYFYHECTTKQQIEITRSCTKNLRLCISGSAKLTAAQFQNWYNITNHHILERYGMTETGMILSNDYDNRQVGYLGKPLPNVKVKMEQDTGELLVQSKSVFPQYWNNEEQTKKTFTSDGFFKTGDIVEFDPSNGYYKLLGRDNADIVKSNGFKISTLEIEEVIRQFKAVDDCCVFGIPDHVLGEKIIATLILNRNELDYKSDTVEKDTDDILIDHIKSQLHDQLPRFKIPREFVIINDLPKNIMGKVQKQILKARFLNTSTLSS